MNAFQYAGIVAACLLKVGATSAEPTFTLVKDGKPACSIIIAENPSYNADYAAKELQTYIHKISGAKLEIRSDAGNIGDENRILVGSSRLTDAIKELKIPTGMTMNLREEGYILHCKGNTLVLAGNDAIVKDTRDDKIRCPIVEDSTMGESMYLGTRYAVYDLLGRLGVRWFMPGQYGEVIPKSATLQISELSVDEHPDFPVRAYGIGTDGVEMARDLFLWLLHNRMNPRSVGWFGMVADGTIGNILPKDQIKAHPEWFALQPDGTRNPNQPCMTDELRRKNPKYAGQPRLLDEILKKIEPAVNAHQHVTDFAPEDGAPVCACGSCRRMSYQFPDGMAYGPTTENAIAQEYFFFVNTLLDAVAEKYPGYWVATNGYFNRLSPPELGPEFNKHRNLTVMFADMLACSMHGFDDPRCWQNRQQYSYLKQWCRLSDKVWIYGYNYSLANTTGEITPMTRRAIRTIPLMKKAGAIGFHDLDVSDLMHNGIASYVARFALEWNTDADMEAILRDFYSKWFGPAGSAMQSYYRRLEAAFDDGPYHASNVSILPSIYTPELIARLADDMAAAEAAAISDADKLHVRMERLQFDHARMYVEFLQAQRELRFSDAAKLMREMQLPKKEMRTITKFAGGCGFEYAGMPTQVERMEKLAAMEMLAPLPEVARFSTDKRDAGRSARWMNTDYDDSQWRLCSTSVGWQNQKLKDEDGTPMMSAEGYPYTGLGWYRFAVDVPAVPDGKDARLFLPGVVSQAWVWVNGDYAGRGDYAVPWLLPQEMDIGISRHLKPGKNVIALRVLEANPYVGASGIYERPFLYTKRR